MFDLSGKTALVTGGGRGLGLEMAKALARADARVFINGRDADALAATVDAAGAEGVRLEAVAGDVQGDAARIVADVVAAAGGLDILIHGVGVRDRRGIRDLPVADFSRLVETDLVAAYGMAQAALPHLEHAPAGRLIFVTSIAATHAKPGDPAYTAAKGGLEALTRSLAVEIGADRLTVNAISPGWFATETNRHLAEDESLKPFVEARIPLKRWGRPDEIASAAVFLAAPESSFVNGHTLVVDGGMTAQM